MVSKFSGAKRFRRNLGDGAFVHGFSPRKGHFVGGALRNPQRIAEGRMLYRKDKKECTVLRLVFPVATNPRGFADLL